MIRPPTLWERHFRTLQHVVALAIAAGIITAIELWFGRERFVSALANNRGAFYGAVAQISGSLCGFTITSLTIMISLVERAQFINARWSKQYWPLMRIFFDAVFVQAVLCVLALAAMFLDTDALPTRWVPYGVILLTSVMIAATYRCLWALREIIRAGALPRPPGLDGHENVGAAPPAAVGFH